MFCINEIARAQHFRWQGIHKMLHLSAVSVQPIVYHLINAFIRCGFKWLSPKQGVDQLGIPSAAQQTGVIYNRLPPYPGDKYLSDPV